MRPDFILHYPDQTDIVVDCKVSLNALSDYFSAETDEARRDAAARNLKAIMDQADGLSRKDYASYLKPGRKCLDYTVMFVPNVNALILARQLNPHIIADAFRKNVLITSEETLMPFLRLVRTAWVNFEQARNQEKLVAAAQRMVDRVSDFCSSYAEVGKKLEDAQKSFMAGDKKLRESGQSIVRAAREVESLGVKSKKILPELIED
ncbi:MAG: DNA recombination protein RmuC [Bacteroidales bacterium]|nr:DNA recombination protein RmuC [Bacteroidales bacterium]